MTGLYEGAEEIPFKKIDGGYVFQANNPWFFGPKQRYFVTETQKAGIAACLKDTLRRMKPLVFIAMVLIPLALVAGIFLIVLSSRTLDISLTDASGKTTSYNQSIGLTGSSGTIAGTHELFHVSAPIGETMKITYSRVDAAGKTDNSTTVTFSGTAKLNITDATGVIINRVVFSSRIGVTPLTILLESMLLALALFTPYIGAIHIYTMRRLRPLIAELPRTDAKISIGEMTSRFATKISPKLFIIMGAAVLIGFVSNVMILIEGLLKNSSIETMELNLISAALAGFALAYTAYMFVLRVRAKHNAT